MGRNKSCIDLSVFSCSLSQFLSLVFSSCSEVNCLHKSSLVQKMFVVSCLLDLYLILLYFAELLLSFCFLNFGTFLSTEDCLLKSPAICVFLVPFLLELLPNSIASEHLLGASLCLGSLAPSGSGFESLTLIPLI